MSEKIKSILIHLSEREFDRLDYCSRKCGVSKDIYIRNIINGVTPKEQPPVEYFEMLRELSSTASNLNRLICNFNEIYDINPTLFFQDYKLFSETLNKIQKTVQFHEKENDKIDYERERYART